MGDKPLRLTRKEKELLELLESQPGRCFSRPFLLRHVWGYSDEARTRTVDVHVSRLRKKLGERRDIAIHAVVRRGYMLERQAAVAN
jgi:two-component system phosphate regulon response regulator PhoB